VRAQTYTTYSFIIKVSENVEELITNENKTRVKGIGYGLKWLFCVYIGGVKTEIT
jgi:hypothetical protein